MSTVVKDYPFDKFLRVVVWPMERARTAQSKSVKALLLIAYVPWVFLCIPIMFPALFISLGMAIWDDVNEDTEEQ